MYKFKIGDKVRCLVNNDSSFKFGEIYEVARYCDEPGPHARMGILLDSLNSNTNGWKQSFFELENNIIINSATTLQPRKDYNYFSAVSSIKKVIKDCKSMYNLSQEEIDQIMKEIKAESGTQQSFNYEYSGPKPQAIGLKPLCSHDWKVYQGLNQIDTYCTKCNEIQK